MRHEENSRINSTQLIYPTIHRHKLMKLFINPGYENNKLNNLIQQMTIVFTRVKLFHTNNCLYCN